MSALTGSDASLGRPTAGSVLSGVSAVSAADAWAAAIALILLGGYLIAERLLTH